MAHTMWLRETNVGQYLDIIGVFLSNIFTLTLHVLIFSIHQR